MRRWGFERDGVGVAVWTREAGREKGLSARHGDVHHGGKYQN